MHNKKGILMGLKIGRNAQAVLLHDPDSEYAPIH